MGIAIGIAAMVAVVGISASSKADLLAEIDSLGTGMLRAAPGQSAFGDDTTLPEKSRETAGRIGPVLGASGLTYTGASVRRTDYISSAVTGGLSVVATDTDLLATTNAELRAGRFLDDASSQVPTVVLGADAAARLGIDDLDAHPRVYLTGEDGRGQWFDVIGILEPAALAPEIDSAVLVGYGVAAALWDTTTSPSTLFVSADPTDIEAVRDVLARSVKPQAPNEVDVSRPSDALEARAQTDEALRNLLLALGAVALLVGGVGITNVMVIAVLERRAEIGVRRALGRDAPPHRRSVHGGVEHPVVHGGRARHGARCRRDRDLRPGPWLDARRAGRDPPRRHRAGARRRPPRRGVTGDPRRPPRPRGSHPSRLTTAFGGAK